MTDQSHQNLTPLDQTTLVFLDIESTGLSAKNDRVCEVALLRVRGAVVEASYTTLVNPQQEMGAQAFSVHGITPEMLADAPLFAQIAPNLLPLLTGATLVAHNAPFDIAFLAGELARLNLAPLNNLVLDTLTLSRRLLKRRSHSLAALSDDLALHTPNHRAMHDLLPSRGLSEYLRTELAAIGITTLEDALRYARGLLPGHPEPSAPEIIAQALHEGRLLHIIYRSMSSSTPTERIIRPIEVVVERSGSYLRAFCYLRDDLRSFALEKIDFMELVE